MLFVVICCWLLAVVLLRVVSCLLFVVCVGFAVCCLLFVVKCWLLLLAGWCNVLCVV